jgi:hypothetical protein
MSVTEVQSSSTWASFHRQALERVAAIPGVKYAVFAWGVPLTGNNWPATLEIEDQPPAVKESDKIALSLRAATLDYFKLMGLPLIEGREFRSTDAQSKDKGESGDIANALHLQQRLRLGILCLRQQLDLSIVLLNLESYLGDLLEHRTERLL